MDGHTQLIKGVAFGAVAAAAAIYLVDKLLQPINVGTSTKRGACCSGGGCSKKKTVGVVVDDGHSHSHSHGHGHGHAAAGAASARSLATAAAPAKHIPRGKPRPSARGVDTGDVMQKGKVAVITGAASGIGKATATRLARMGMKLVLADIDRELSKVAEECEEILGFGSGGVVYQFVDVSDYEQVKALATLAIAHFGEVNLLMNNAAIQTNGQCSPCDPAHRERFEKIIKVNLWGVVNMCQAFIPYVLSCERCVLSSQQPARRVVSTVCTSWNWNHTNINPSRLTTFLVAD